MRYLLLVLVILTVPAFAQEEGEQTEGVVVDTSEQDSIELANLKIDLIIQRLATLQAKSNWLDREQRLLQKEDQEWQADRARLIIELTEKFGCTSTYDLNTRRCSGE